jgi:hypothetical protein
MKLVPNRFLFKFEFPLHRCPRPMKLDGRIDAWTAYKLPPLYEIDNEEPTGDVFATWDDAGLYIACSVSGKSRPPSCDPAQFRKSDCLRLMTDMRDTRSIRRATKFCQQFFFLPTGGGKDRKSPVAGNAEIPRAAEHSPPVPSAQISVASCIIDDGYSLTAHLPAAALHGFDPEQHRRIGLFYMLEDTELGHQSLTVGDDLNWYIDPSTWPTAVLTE